MRASPVLHRRIHQLFLQMPLENNFGRYTLSEIHVELILKMRFILTQKPQKPQKPQKLLQRVESHVSKTIDDTMGA